MNKKSFFLGAFTGLIITALIAVICVWTYLSNGGSLMLTDKSSEDFYENVDTKLETIDGLINRFYLYEDEIDEDKLLDGMMYGYMSALEDPYTVYYSEEETNQLNEYMSGTYYGIGAVLSQNMETGAVTVNECFAGSGAEESGLQPYDVILEVDGTDITGMYLEQIVTYIKGDEGTMVNLKVYREGEPDYLYFDIERREIEVPTIEYEVMDGNIGYIEISEFEELTAERFDEAYKELLDQDVKGLIIDLRNNPGGLLTSVTEICNHFVPKDGLIVYTEDKYGNKQELFADTYRFCTVPLVVLVNENSASASEIFAGAVKDYGTGTIIGTTTYGKGVVQQLIPLNDGTSVKVTVSNYFTPNGNNIHGVGVVPDVEVELSDEAKTMSDIPYEKDAQLQAAVKQIEEDCK